MAKLYREITNKRLKRLDLHNENTGEVGSMTVTTYTDAYYEGIHEDAKELYQV